MAAPVPREQTRMYNRNRFKLGLFAPNCSGGVSMLKTELWDGSWEKSLAAVRLADEAGLEFVLPLGRWLGFRGAREEETQGTSYETLTWASAILALTQEICCFGTLHVTFINPVFAAKMMVSADHVGKGRFALNIVTGAISRDFELFGLPFPETADIRYAYCDEWVTIVKRLWTETAPFDHHGTYFNLTGAISKPKPYGGTIPMLVSAANSAAGRRFAARQTDCLFLMINEVDLLGDEIGVFRANAGSNAPVLASGHMVARATRKEAQEYYDYVVRELGDWDVVDQIAEVRTRGRDTPMLRMKKLKERLISGTGTYPVVGSYDDAAAEFARMEAQGLGGMAVGLFDYIGEFPTLQEVAARLQRLGLRE
jgi:alkanesulfonate monooxygenase SsuD/methylene tetrahydromethanopterin reductase-like flavin-dependent oxidoreductase (luciferase family)